MNGPSKWSSRPLFGMQARTHTHTRTHMVTFFLLHSLLRRFGKQVPGCYVSLCWLGHMCVDWWSVDNHFSIQFWMVFIFCRLAKSVPNHTYTLSVRYVYGGWCKRTQPTGTTMRLPPPSGGERTWSVHISLLVSSLLCCNGFSCSRDYCCSNCRLSVVWSVHICLSIIVIIGRIHTLVLLLHLLCTRSVILLTRAFQ